VYSIVVGACHIQPTYFFDEMDADECSAIIEAYNESYKNQWEQTRYVAYIVAATTSDKIKQPQDLMKFSWEFEDDNRTISKEERIIREKEMLDWLNKK